MDWYRLRHTIGMCLQGGAFERANYLRKHHIFFHVGDNCLIMGRKIPLYPRLISLGDNVCVASNVLFVTHDAIHVILNRLEDADQYNELIGCIDVKDNVFIGANTTILPNVVIGPNVIIGACSLVNKSVADGVYGGVPARYICSIEEYKEKRKKTCTVKPSFDKNGLTEETMKEYWNILRQKKLDCR